MIERRVLVDGPDYTIEIEDTEDYLIFHMPACARVRVKRMRASIFALGLRAKRQGKRVACAIPHENTQVLRLVRALGMTEAPIHHMNTDGLVVFFLQEGSICQN